VTRSSDICKIKGTLVNPAVIHDVIMNTADVLEYQAVVSRQDPDDDLSPDRFRIRIAVEPHATGGWRTPDGPAAQLRARVHDAIEVTPEIEVIDHADQIYDLRRDFKARRFIDERPR